MKIQISIANHNAQRIHTKPSVIEAVQRLRNGTLSTRAACITFDDSYAGNAEVALPILQKYGISATFFIATGFINGGIMWNDRLIELIRRAKGDTLDLTRIGMEIGAHTVEHPILTRVENDKANSEMINSKEMLEDIIDD